jgi:hypothetical protein
MLNRGRSSRWIQGSRDLGCGAGLDDAQPAYCTVLRCVVQAMVGPERAGASQQQILTGQTAVSASALLTAVLSERLSCWCSAGAGACACALCFVLVLVLERASRNNCLWLDGMIQRNGSCVCSDGKDKNRNGPQFVDAALRRGRVAALEQGTVGLSMYQPSIRCQLRLELNGLRVRKEVLQCNVCYLTWSSVGSV